MRHGHLAIILPAGVAAGIATVLPGAGRGDGPVVMWVGFVGAAVATAAALFPAGARARLVAWLGAICGGLALGAVQLVDEPLAGAWLVRVALLWMWAGWGVWTVIGIREQRRQLPLFVAAGLGVAAVATFVVTLALAPWQAAPPPTPSNVDWPSLEDLGKALCSEGRCK